MNKSAPDLVWLPAISDFQQEISALEIQTDADATWMGAFALSKKRLDFIQTGRLDKLLGKKLGPEPPVSVTTKPLRLAVLGSSMVTHLLPGIKIGALRRGIWAQTYEPTYGQFLQELSDAQSGLYKFNPNTIIFALDSVYATRGLEASADKDQANEELDRFIVELRQTWTIARKAFECPIIQQTFVPTFPSTLGSNEQRLPGSRQRMISRLNERLREIAEEDGVDLLAIDAQVAQNGLSSWCDPALWHRAKQEISPAAGPYYGDLVGRLLAAEQGLSAKCLVLDLDNTIWGGVIGDDGLDGIVLGQGSATGEAYLALQAYAKEQSTRGIILAVCSKNDPENALSPFEKHPEMILKREDISDFVANWDDKATNLRAIAQHLNIGLDSLVFVDDSPFERELVRSELPMISTPELPEDPALIPGVLAAAGYFEGLAVTQEDRARGRQYQANADRQRFQATVTDMALYLRGLEMKLVVQRFDRLSLKRIVQLINKTNQFNLTARRYTEDEVLNIMRDQTSFGLQLRLLDRFGDNGIIAIVIGRGNELPRVEIDTWLMSCRVLGRGIEQATLDLIAAEARHLGARDLIGRYRQTPKNVMVKDHYGKLGFSLLATNPGGETSWKLDLANRQTASTFIEIIESQSDG